MERFYGPETVLAYLQEVERKAEDVLVDRRQVTLEQGDSAQCWGPTGNGEPWLQGA